MQSHTASAAYGLTARACAAARTAAPRMETVKYSLERRVWPSPFPQIVLNRTDPPMPISRPRL